MAHNILNEDFGSTGEKDFSAFLFDISLLFEHHIRSLLQTKFQLNAKNNREFIIPNGLGYSNIYPDVIIYNDDGSISIYDVKYKHFGYEVNREDRFQLVSYVALYMHKHKIKECGFIYPKKLNKESNNMKTQTLKIAGEEIPFKIIFYDIAEEEKQDNEEKNEFTLFKNRQKKFDEVFLNAFLEKNGEKEI